MIPIILGCAAVLLCAALSLYLYRIGLEMGVEMERTRCLNVCYGALKQGKLSPTVQRVSRSIEDGRETLITEDEFYG